MALDHPELPVRRAVRSASGSTFKDPGSAAFEIAKTIGGDRFSSTFLAGLVVAQSFAEKM